MSVDTTKSSQTLNYSSKTIKRAAISLMCSPFTLKLLETMGTQRVPMSAIATDAGIKHGYTKRSLSELTAENALMWLIQVGVLRREVDGQGITDSFRLTPLGRQLIAQYQGQPWQNPTWRDRAYYILNRWLRLPFSV